MHTHSARTSGTDMILGLLTSAFLFLLNIASISICLPFRYANNRAFLLSDRAFANADTLATSYVIATAAHNPINANGIYINIVCLS